MTHLTEEQEKQIFEMGRLGFSYKEVAINFDFKVTDIAIQFAQEQGNVYIAWKKGNIQAIFEIRDNLMKSALNGSTPALQNMLQVILNVDKLNEDADEFLS